MEREALTQEERSRLQTRYDEVVRELDALPGRRKRRELTGQAYYKRRDELYRERKSISKALYREPARVPHPFRRKGWGINCSDRKLPTCRPTCDATMNPDTCTSSPSRVVDAYHSSGRPTRDQSSSNA